MAENKKSFILYCDQMNLFKNLDDDEAGRLIKHIFEYVNDENPNAPDKITKIAFEPIKMQLKRDLIKYEGKKDQWSSAGKASAEKRALNKLNESQRNPTDVKTVATDSTVNDNVTVNVNDNVKNKEKVKTFTPPTLDEIKNYFKDSGYTEQSAEKAYNYYSVADWSDSKGNKIKNWKQKMQGVWFKDENKQPAGKGVYDLNKPAPQPSGRILQ